MDSILLAMVVIALLGTAGTTAVVGRVVLTRINEQTKPVVTPVEPPSWGDDIADVNARVDRLTLAVSDGIERVHRAESRVAKTVTSARRVVREAGLEHAGIEAEYDQLRAGDAEAIEPLPPMSEEVESTRIVRFPGGQLEIGV